MSKSKKSAKSKKPTKLKTPALPKIKTTRPAASKAQKVARSKKPTKTTSQPSELPPMPQNEAGKPQNPYRQGGNYHACVEAVRSLGVGKMHPLPEVLDAIKKAMGHAAWVEFVAKAPHGSKGKDADARALANVSVIARKDYGRPLRDIGMEVRWDGRKKEAGLFKL